jgi:hypothetical protein
MSRYIEPFDLFDFLGVKYEDPLDDLTRALGTKYQQLKSKKLDAYDSSVR